MSIIRKNSGHYRYQDESDYPDVAGGALTLKQKPGHFEIDTIFGKDQKSFLLTVVDKAVKLVIPNKRAETVVAAFMDIVANTFCEFKTLTADNGSEFAQHEEITKITGHRSTSPALIIPGNVD